jgi:hypothetical protein
MDAVGIPSIIRDDKRAAPKDDKRTQNQQTDVMLSNPASRMRRKEWLQSRKGKKRPDMDNDVTITSPYDKESVPVDKKRKRAPNRPKYIIA